jgi:hypothetical protein
MAVQVTVRSLTAGAVVVLCGLGAGVPSASAQTTADRGSVYASAGYQSGASDVAATGTFAANVETGSFTTRFPVTAGPAFEVGGQVRVWRLVSAGAAITRFSQSGDATITADIPHPFFFDQPRTVAGTETFERRETAFHLRVVVSSPAGRRFSAAAFAGPSFFSVSQTVATSVNYSDAYPYDTATFTNAATTLATASKTGVHAGAAVTYFVTKQFGIGATATYATASMDVAGANDTPVHIKAGGLIAGAGIRIRF